MDAMDRRVLRFFCAWDDRANGGVVSRYVLNYFLGDGTVEVLEEQLRNAGRDPFPKMLARSRLPAHGAFDVGVPGEGRLGAGSPAHVSRASSPRGRYRRGVREDAHDSRLRRLHARVLRQGGGADHRGDGSKAVRGVRAEAHPDDSTAQRVRQRGGLARELREPGAQARALRRAKL